MNKRLKLSFFALTSLVATSVISNEITPDFLKKEIKLAHTQYLIGSTESGLYALQALARVLESDDSSSLQSQLGPNNLSFTYLRIGLLHEQLGEKSKTTEYFNKALTSYKGEKIEIVQLKKLVLTLDEQRS